MKNMSATFGLIVASVLLAACGERPSAATGEGKAASESDPVSRVAGRVQPQAAVGLRMPAGNGGDAKCNIETIDGIAFEGARPAVSADRTLELLGWYAGPEGADVRLVLASEAGGYWVVGLPERLPRPDVAASLGDESALQSGFAVNLDLSELPPGQYSIYLANTANNAESACGVGRAITLQAS